MLKKAIHLLLILGLSACGGDSKDSKEDDVVIKSQKPTITLAYNKAYVNEGETIEIPFTFTNDSGEEYTISTTDTDTIEASIENNKLILKINNVNKDKIEEPIIKIMDSFGLQDDQKVNVSIKNLINPDSVLNLIVLNTSIELQQTNGLDATYLKEEVLIEVKSNGDHQVKYALKNESNENTGLNYFFDEEMSKFIFSYSFSGEEDESPTVLEYDFLISVHSNTAEAIKTRTQSIKIKINKSNNDSLMNQINYIYKKIQESSINDEEEKSLLYYLVDVAENNFSIDLKESKIIKIDINNISLEKMLKGNIQDLSHYLTFIDNFKQEIQTLELEEAELKKAYSDFLNSLRPYELLKKIESLKMEKELIKGDFYKNIIEEFSNNFHIKLPKIHLGKVYNFGSFYSSFIGNPNYGYIKENFSENNEVLLVWVPYSQYKFIEAILLVKYDTNLFVVTEQEEEKEEEMEEAQ